LRAAHDQLTPSIDDRCCRAGLFVISLSVEFSKVAGIALFANLHRLRDADCPAYHPTRRHSFLYPAKDYPPAPNHHYSRPKGCEDLLYASRYVHIRARDIGAIVYSTRGHGNRRGYTFSTASTSFSRLYVESIAFRQLYIRYPTNLSSYPL